MTRSARQIKILELINKNQIQTQDELAYELHAAGFRVTQATISRDIKELGLVKVPIDNKHQKYAHKVSDSNIANKIENIFRHSVQSINRAKNLIVIKTLTANAQNAGAMIDKLNNPDILGCVAGDDTLLVIAKDDKAAEYLVTYLNEIIDK